MTKFHAGAHWCIKLLTMELGSAHFSPLSSFHLVQYPIQLTQGMCYLFALCKTHYSVLRKKEKGVKEKVYNMT